ncbi:MAG: hypothetical protein AAF415_04520 [Pseudomonadota bacterium]
MKHPIRRPFALLLCLAIGAFGPATLAAAEEPSPAAVAFVTGFSDDHLAGMLSRIGSRSPVLASFAQIDGRMTAQAFDANIAKAVHAHGAEWRHNMALSWTPLLNEEELTSLTNAGAQSPYTDKYLELRGDAGVKMQSLSNDFFQQILREVIDNTVADLTPDEAPEGSNDSN